MKNLFLTSVFMLIFLNIIQGQQSPNNFVFTNQAASQSTYSVNGWGQDYNTGTTYNVNFGYSSAGVTSNDKVLSHFDLNGKTYSPITLYNGECYDNIIVNRVANSNVGDLDKQTLFFEYGSRSGSNAYYKPTYTNIVEVVNTRILNRGGDNVFSNQGGQTLNNIERIDLIISGGAFTPNASEAGFLINERGGNDEFTVAAITGLDANGHVSSIGSLVNSPISAWANTGQSIKTTVFMRDSNDTYMRPSQDLSSQNIHGVFFTYSDLGIAANTTIYGLCVFPGDVSSAMDLIGLTDVPLNTTAASNAAGGLDLMGGGGYFGSSSVIVTDLSVNISANVTQPATNDPVDITVRADNNGPLLDSNIVVTTTIPTGYTYTGVQGGYLGNVSVSGNTVTWTFDELTVGNSQNLVIHVTTNATGGRIFNSTISGDKVDVVPGNNSSSLELLSSNDNSTLPVNWLLFEASQTDKQAQLHWATAAEVNNDYFMVQRSSDNYNFDNIARIKGNGNTNIRMDYYWDDAAVQNGMVYYRIVQVDYDGKQSQSTTIAVLFKENQIIKIFPNPAQNFIQLKGLEEETQIEIYDIQGKQMLAKNMDAMNNKIQVDVLPKGVYYLRIVQGNHITNKRFIKN